MFRTTHTQRGANGFTMTEILTVTTLIGLASAVAIPQFSANTEQYAQNAARSIAQNIQYAQDLAVTTQSPVTMSISTSGYVYTLKDNQGATLTHPISRKPFIVDLADDPNMAQLSVSQQFSGIQNIVFDAFGTPNTGGSITISSPSMTSDVVLMLHAGTGSVTVSQN